MTDAIETYVADLEARGCKQSTITARTWQARRILARLAEAGLTADPRRIGEREVRYLATDTSLKESTAKIYVGLLADICAVHGNTVPKEVRILWNRTVANVVWIDTADLRAMLEVATPPERIVLVLGSMAGLRASEISTLEVGSIHRDSITVRGKGHGRGLEVDQPIPPEVRAELDRYLAWRARQRPISDRLVIWRGNEHVDPENARIILYGRVRKLGESVGVRVTPHALRRLYATTMYEAGVDIMTISRLMRHASVETTMRYINQDRRRDYEAIGRLVSALG